MHPKRLARKPLFWGMVLVAGLAGAMTSAQQPIAVAQPPLPQPVVAPPDVQVDPKTGSLIVPLGGLVQWMPLLPDIPTDIVVSREDILQVRVDPNDPKKYLLTGRVTGVAQVTFLFKGSPKRTFDVIVQPDLNLLRALIRRTVPTAQIDVQPGIGNVIIISGYVTSPQDADTVNRLAISAVGGGVNNVINAVQVGGGQHVQIDLVVASVDRNMLRSRGFDFFVGGQTVNFASIVSGLLTPTTGTAGAPTFSGNSNLQLGIIPTPIYAAIRALRTEGIAKFISEPKVVTQSGRPAFIRAGGQQAILSSTSGITGPGVQLVPFGTEMEVLPIVYGNGMIWLEINPRITAVSQGLGITVGGALSPGFTEQTVRAAVMLESGQTYAIGGLIQNTVQATTSKVPFFGDLPFVGIAFSSLTHQQTESELLILVTPRLVGPMNCDQVPKRVPGRETRNPDDYELFLENILEAPRGQRKVWNGRCYNAAYKCDPTAAYFPCVGGVCNGRPGSYGPMTAPPGVQGPAMPSALPPLAAPGTPGPVTPAPVALPGAAPVMLAPAGPPSTPMVLPPAGPPSQGVPSQGVPSQGVPSQGVPSQGVPSQGYPSQGAPNLPNTLPPVNGSPVGSQGVNEDSQPQTVPAGLPPVIILPEGSRY
jgi:pilus assembly protein CpaC